MTVLRVGNQVTNTEFNSDYRCVIIRIKKIKLGLYSSQLYIIIIELSLIIAGKFCPRKTKKNMETYNNAKLANLRVFLWNDDTKHNVVSPDQGLFILNPSNQKENPSSIDRDPAPIVVSFELNSLRNIHKPFHNVFAKQLISKTKVFDLETTEQLAQQVATYIISCFNFRPKLATALVLDRPRLVFVADILVNDILKEESNDYVNFDTINSLFTDLVQFQQQHNHSNNGAREEALDFELNNRDFLDFSIAENNNNNNNNDVIGVDSSNADFEVSRNEEEDATFLYFRQERDHLLELLRGLPTFTHNLNLLNLNFNPNFMDFSIPEISDESSDLEGVEDNNLEEFNYVLGILRSWDRRKEEHDDKDESVQRASKRAKVMQDDTELLKSLSKIKPTIVLAKQEELSEDSICSICLEKMSSEVENKKMVRCKHVFHGACLFKWLPNNQSCPNCRTTSLANVCF